MCCVQVNKLVAAGAQVLSPVAVGPQRTIGTIVDYVMHSHSQVYTAVASCLHTGHSLTTVVAV